LGVYDTFSIIESVNNKEVATLISPDIATCEDCMEEVFNYKDRRYRYPFTNCTNCGPRFTIIKQLPYDRRNTTMEDFPMCSSCRNEYYNPLDRRFHAEPTCCEQCGPMVEVCDNKGQKLMVKEPFSEIRELLKKGAIVAVKGIGGFNLICDGSSKDSIDKLRSRKYRRTKPLALMMRDIGEVEKYCDVGGLEKMILTGSKKPIVLLRKVNEKLPENISFNNRRLGVVLPYSPLHYFLFDDELRVLIFTSGNISGGAIQYKNETAIEKLSGIADYFFTHNREINMKIDDSVVKVELGGEQVIRGGRGYAPLYINSKSRRKILACGAQLKNTFSISVKDNVYVSPYIGDLETVEVQENFKSNLKHVMDLYNLSLDIIAYDMHPNYWHQEFIKGYSVRKLGVFHHHAHIVSCLVDNEVKEKVIGVAFDGIGYGRDGNLWGGEFLICDYKCFKRVGQLNYMDMPGGDSAALNPWIMGVSLVNMALAGEKEKVKEALNGLVEGNKVEVILAAIAGSKRNNLCSSMGRLFDGVASLLGFEDKVTYEGEGAIYLENLAIWYKEKEIKKIESYVYRINCKDGMLIIDTRVMIQQILLDLKLEKEVGEIALRFHETIIEFSKDICERLRSKYNINKVALSGGCFQNNLLLEGIYHHLSDSGFEVLTHKNIPCNDSGISIGQFFIANEIARE
ncbi:MAG: carbamoyltransferase HypF, partial [Clostridium sp.]